MRVAADNQIDPVSSQKPGQLPLHLVRSTFVFVAPVHAGDHAIHAVVLDRYVYSNVGFQCAKLPAGDRQEELRRWILDLEFGYYGIPRPDVSLFLDVPFAFTEKKLSEVREGDDREYLKGERDIHEASLDLQRRVREVYRAAAAADDRLRIIDCSDARGGMDSPDAIFARIRTEIERFR